ncbi:hypothetical protein F2Q70_00022917 [Brassica cretica]|uniref:Uncharacterized protein n=1 Tax=Brassica cretica TaxID=69181 RepID=A0A8S9GS90_BRACR|nr:hypothetical protein F2Q70_00022917 [Brassica cretica]
MAASSTLLANLRAGRCSNNAEVRLLRVRVTAWNLIIFSLKQSTLIHGTVAASRVDTYRHLFVEGLLR